MSLWDKLDAAAANAANTRPDALISNKYLDKGTHQCTVTAVDTTAIDDNKVTFTFTAGGKVYVERAWVIDERTDTINRTFARLLMAVFADWEFVTGVVLPNIKVSKGLSLEAMVGCTVVVKLERGEGWECTFGTNGVTAVDTKTRDVLGGPCKTAAELRALMLPTGIKQAFLNGVFEPNNGVPNRAAYSQGVLKVEARMSAPRVAKTF